MMDQPQNPFGIPTGGYNITLSLPEYFVITQKGTLQNASFQVAAQSKTNNQENPISVVGTDYGILLWSIQFDGINPGQVGYNFNFGINELGGYAVNGVIVPINIFVPGSQLNYEIDNSLQTTPIAVNILYVSLPRNIALNELLNPLFALSAGGKYGIVKG